MLKCEVCEGKGIKDQVRQIAEDVFVPCFDDEIEDCENCEGTGKTIK